MNVIKAGVAYVLIVFAVAFVFGAVRVTFIAPATGPLIAVLMELPFILVTSWFAASYIIRKHAIEPVAAPRLAMGAIAFAVLMALELALGLGFGRSLSVQASELLTAHGMLGLAGQVLFGLMPWIVLQRRS